LFTVQENSGKFHLADTENFRPGKEGLVDPLRITEVNLWRKLLQGGSFRDSLEDSSNKNHSGYFSINKERDAYKDIPRE